MAEGSVAPKERVNIVYKPALGDAQQEIELPLKLVMMGDYTLRQEDTPLQDRKLINVDKDNFNAVMRSQNLHLTFNVANRLSGQEGDEMPMNLKFETLKDFEPENVVRQVPELNQLLELREALRSLRGPLANVPAIRQRIQALLADDTAREKLLKELKLEDTAG
jgi:type VI secretion system protein ImpB